METKAYRGTVLFVDDGEAVRYMAGLMLERAGFRALTAEDGIAALEVFERHADEIDLVILDLHMPRMSGEEALSKIKTLRPETKVVLSSGLGEPEIQERFKDKGLAGFIQKPYQYEVLVKLINKVMGTGE